MKIETKTLAYLKVILKKEAAKSRKQSIIDKAKHKASLIEFKKNYIRTNKNETQDVLKKNKTNKKNRSTSRCLKKAKRYEALSIAA